MTATRYRVIEKAPYGVPWETCPRKGALKDDNYITHANLGVRGVWLVAVLLLLYRQAVRPVVISAARYLAVVRGGPINSQETSNAEHHEQPAHGPDHGRARGGGVRRAEAEHAAAVAIPGARPPVHQDGRARGALRLRGSRRLGECPGGRGAGAGGGRVNGVVHDPDRNVWLLVVASAVVGIYASQAAAVVAAQEAGEGDAR